MLIKNLIIVHVMRVLAGREFKTEHGIRNGKIITR